MSTKELVTWPVCAADSAIDRDQALDALARRCGPRACSIARSQLRDAAEAEDVVQEALFRTYERLDQLRDPAALDAWFYRILIRLCLNSMRKRKRWRRIAARWRPVSSTTPAASAQDSGRLLDAVARLPDQQRLAIVLRYGHELTVEEAAAALDVRIATAKTHLVRGLKRLRALLGANDDD